MTDAAGRGAPAPTASPPSPRPPARYAVLTLALAAVILSPLARERGWDSFPISSYPMFSRGSIGAVNDLAHAVLVLEDGARVPASPSLLGTPEPMVATAIVRAYLASGAAEDLCAIVAARARPARPEAVAVEIVTSRFDARRYFSGAPGAREPLERAVYARCEISP
ncbi:MAG: hypothetical protein KF782_29580 [Labilithrix sp.]|nr:hypothetical protein [Labilithrix sp.]